MSIAPQNYTEKLYSYAENANRDVIHPDIERLVKAVATLKAEVIELQRKVSYFEGDGK